MFYEIFKSYVYGTFIDNKFNIDAPCFRKVDALFSFSPYSLCKLDGYKCNNGNTN